MRVGELAAGHTEVRVAHLASGAVNVDAGSTCPRAALTAVDRGHLDFPFGCCSAGCGAMQQQHRLVAYGDSALGSAAGRLRCPAMVGVRCEICVRQSRVAKLGEMVLALWERCLRQSPAASWPCR